MSAEVVDPLGVSQKLVQGLPVHFEKVNAQGRSRAIAEHHRLMDCDVRETRLLHDPPDGVCVSRSDHEVDILCGPGDPIVVYGMATYHHGIDARPRQTTGDDLENHIGIKVHIAII